MADILFNGFSLIKKLKSISALFPSLRNFRSMNHRPNDPHAALNVCAILNSERSAKHRGPRDSSIMLHVYLMCIKISDKQMLKKLRVVRIIIYFCLLFLLNICTSLYIMINVWSLTRLF